MSITVVILAAGQGTRMKSKLPKVLHPIAGKPMIEYALEAARRVGADKPTVVVGYEAERVKAVIGDRATCVEQREQLGTGHAVLQARTAIEGQADTVMVTYGDMPLLSSETLLALYDRHRTQRACLTLLTVVAEDSMGFGRIVRDDFRHVIRIVEESEAGPAELAIRELNCGVYCFDSDWLWGHLARLRPSPKKQEYFLTDLVGLAAAEQVKLESETLADPTEVMGINNRVQLATVEKIARNRIRASAMLAGVTLIDPESTYIDAEVEIGEDTIIYPGTHLLGKTTIGADCRIGPQAQIRDSHIGPGCEIGSSFLENTTLEPEVHVGPYCHLRPGTVLARGVHLGDHVELKNAIVGPETRMGHFCYVGDAEVGARVNIAAGTITCNFDGLTRQKYRTVIGDDVFLGSDTMLRAPVTIGRGAMTGAGAVVTQDIPPDSLAVGMPARVIRKLK